MAVVPALSDFDFLLATALENFMIACRPLGEPLISLSLKVQHAFKATRELIAYGLENPEPSKDGQQPPIMKQYVEAIGAVVEFKDNSKGFENHLSTVREAIVALGFMNVKPAPTQFIRDMIDASQYYANRVLSQNKGIEKHMLFVTKNTELFSDLLQFVKKHFLTGFSWNSLPKTLRGSVPPPPPPPMQLSATPVCNEASDGARIALLNQLNQGSDITRCLKPVKRDGSTSQPVKQSNVKHEVAAAKPQKVFPPKLMLEGKKWCVEHQKNNQGMLINNEDMSESVALYKVENSSLAIQNKVNNVVIDSCKKSAVTLQSVISSVELIRCESVTITCLGVVPLINLENCDSIQIFLSTKSRNVEMVSSKSSSCNVCLLEDDGNYKELAMAEQIKFVLKGEKLVSSVMEKY